jgi:DNA mismatch repair protein MutH
LERARAIAGLTLGELAARLARRVPRDLRAHKGWAGELIEQALGASSGSRAAPDFPDLGIELKTLPVSADGRPLESTHVCILTLTDCIGIDWDHCPVRAKLARVLWVPVEGARKRPLAGRRVGNPLLWSPSPDQERRLRIDWEEIMERVGVGELDQVNARHGACLQLRPKAADARSLTPAIGADGARVMTLPRGFYLRAAFTAEILAGAYLLTTSPGRLPP